MTPTSASIDPRSERPFWLSELFAHAEVQFGDRHGAFWLGIDYHVPPSSSPSASQSDAHYGHLAPQTRVDFEFGGVISAYQEGWDVYATYRVADRRELEIPASTLPIPNGGFDQIQLMVGVRHQFGFDSEQRPPR